MNNNINHSRLYDIYEKLKVLGKQEDADRMISGRGVDLANFTTVIPNDKLPNVPKGNIYGNGFDKLDDALKLTSGEDYAQKLYTYQRQRDAMEKMGKGGLRMPSVHKKAIRGIMKNGLKSLPVFGGIMAALATGDASAAIPVLGDVSPVGQGSDMPEMRQQMAQEEKNYTNDGLRKVNGQTFANMRNHFNMN